MKIIIQRCSKASVTVEGQETAKIGYGMLILVGIQSDDTKEDIEWLTKKIIGLRIFDDENGVMNNDIKHILIDEKETVGDIIIVSQFTLMASTKKGNRPSWLKAAPHSISVPLYEKFCKSVSEALGKPVGRGIFGADMKVELLNDGPVTIIIDSKNKE